MVTDSSGTFFKISDLVLTDEQIKNTIVTMSGGEFLLSEIWDMFVVREDATVTDAFAFIKTDNVILFNGAIFPESGIYSIGEDEYRVISMTIPN